MRSPFWLLRSRGSLSPLAHLGRIFGYSGAPVLFCLGLVVNGRPVRAPHHHSQHHSQFAIARRATALTPVQNGAHLPIPPSPSRRRSPRAPPPPSPGAAAPACARAHARARGTARPSATHAARARRARRAARRGARANEKERESSTPRDSRRAGTRVMVPERGGVGASRLAVVINDVFASGLGPFHDSSHEDMYEDRAPCRG